MVDFILAAALIVLQIPDILTTNRIVGAGGRELNPLVRGLMRLGFFWWVPKFLVAVVCAVVFLWTGDDGGRLVMMGIIVVYALAVASNYRQIQRMKRRGLL